LKLDITARQKRAVETELKIVRSGLKGEKTSAYFIDFNFGDSKNWAVLHDLRIEHDGKVAQVDHLLINRLMEVYVLESKNYANGIKITEDGEFLVLFHGKTKAIESPIEQNKRHIYVLKKFFKSIEVHFPKRLGITMQPSLYNYVIVSPGSKVIRPPKKRFDSSSVIKSDALYTLTQENVDGLSPLAIGKIIGQDNLLYLARQIAKYHKPNESINYRKKFGISDESEAVDNIPVEPETEEVAAANPENSEKKSSAWRSGYFCAKCKAKISKKAAMFCFNNKSKFGGKAFCFDCQKSIN
jgi:hypothetical protein